MRAPKTRGATGEHGIDKSKAEKTAAKSASSRTPDLRSPFVVDIRDMGRQAGTMRTWRHRVLSPEHLGTDVVGVVRSQPLELDLRLEAVTEGVLVTGTVATELQAECGRCLDPVVDELVLDVCELFAYPNSTTDETTEEDEVHRIVGDALDLEQMVRDGIVLGLPATLLCRHDCAGLCPDCGQRLDDLAPGHTHDQIDPRWAALAHLPMSSSQTSQE